MQLKVSWTTLRKGLINYIAKEKTEALKSSIQTWKSISDTFHLAMPRGLISPGLKDQFCIVKSQSIHILLPSAYIVILLSQFSFVLVVVFHHQNILCQVLWSPLDRQKAGTAYNRLSRQAVNGLIPGLCCVYAESLSCV